MVYSLSKTTFSKEVVLKVAYLWQEDFNITISEDDNNFLLNIEPKTQEIKFDFSGFNSMLQEQQLREMLNTQFGILRESIYNKAFEHFSR